MKASYLKPLLPLRDIVIFPTMVVPLFVGREKSIKALQEVMKTDKSIVLVTQKNSETDDPDGKDLYQFGCLSKVLQLLKLPDGTVKVLVEGEKRVKILNYKEDDSKDYLNCEVEIIEDSNVSKDLEQLAVGLVKKFERLQVLNKKDFNEKTLPLMISVIDAICEDKTLKIKWNNFLNKNDSNTNLLQITFQSYVHNTRGYCRSVIEGIKDIINRHYTKKNVNCWK